MEEVYFTYVQTLVEKMIISSQMEPSDVEEEYNNRYPDLKLIKKKTRIEDCITHVIEKIGASLGYSKDDLQNFIIQIYDTY